MRIQDKTFNIHDTTIGIWRDSTAQDWETHEAIRMMLVRDGFTFHQDPEIRRRFPTLAKTHHCGHRQDLFFTSRLTGRQHELLFYEDVIRDNQNGGRYHFDKLSKMPYQRRLKAALAIRKVSGLLLSIGFTDASRVYPEDSIAAIMKRRSELEDFQGPDFYKLERLEYNCRDAAGVAMFDGDTRYFWTSNGRLQRGLVYRNINNMWWVATGPHSYTNRANFELFTWKPEMGRKLAATNIVLQKHLRAFVENQQFERAIVMRDLLKERAA